MVKDKNNVANKSTEATEKIMNRDVKPRAEYYSFDELDSMAIFDRYIPGIVEEYLGSYSQYNSERRPLFLIGARGIGKTFSIRKTVCHYNATVHVFKMNEKVEILAKQDATRRSVQVYDDVHYLCEDVINGNSDQSVLLDYFRSMIEDIDAYKKVIVLSDSTLGQYAEKIKNPEFDEMILRFGDFVHSWKNARHILEKCDYIAKLSYPRVSDTQIFGSVQQAGRTLDATVWSYLKCNNVTPRTAVKFVLCFDVDNITYPEMIKEAVNRITNSDLTEKDQHRYVMILTKTPLNIDVDSDIIDLRRVVVVFRKYDNLAQYNNIWMKKWGEIEHIIQKEMFNIRQLNNGYLGRTVERNMNNFQNTGFDTQWKYEPWKSMYRYREILRYLKINKAEYIPDDGVFLGWKGNYYDTYYFLSKLSEGTRKIIWDNPTCFSVVNSKLLPFPVMNIAFNDAFVD